MYSPSEDSMKELGDNTELPHEASPSEYMHLLNLTKHQQSLAVANKNKDPALAEENNHQNSSKNASKYSL